MFARVAWGDVPAWVAAVGTALAFFATFGLLIYQSRQIRILRDEQQDQRNERKKEEARHVSAWFLLADHQDGRTATSYTGDVMRVRIAWRNGSEEPMFDAVVATKSNWGPSHDRKWHRIGVMPPRSGDEALIMIALTASDRMVPPPVEITFSDPAGRRWRRVDDGRLFQWPEGSDSPPEDASWATVARSLLTHPLD